MVSACLPLLLPKFWLTRGSLNVNTVEIPVSWEQVESMDTR